MLRTLCSLDVVTPDRTTGDRAPPPEPDAVRLSVPLIESPSVTAMVKPVGAAAEPEEPTAASIFVTLSPAASVPRAILRAPPTTVTAKSWWVGLAVAAFRAVCRLVAMAANVLPVTALRLTLRAVLSVPLMSALTVRVPDSLDPGTIAPEVRIEAVFAPDPVHVIAPAAP